MGKIICVTGGSGFFGTALVKALLARGESVRVLDYEEPDPALKEQVNFRKVDIRNTEATYQAIRGCDMLYHNAAVVPISRSRQNFWTINRDGTRNVLEAAFKTDVSRVIYYSTSQSLYGVSPKLPISETSPQWPFGDYGKSKYAAEEICRQYREKGLNLSIVRPRTIVGAGRLGIFQLLFEWIRKGSPVYIIGSGKNRLQFIGLDDLIDVSFRLLDQGIGEDFNVGAERFGALYDDLLGLIRHAGTASLVRKVPPTFAKPILAILDVFRLSPFVDLHYKTIDHDFYFDISKAKRVLHWQPRESNLDALVKAYDWYSEHAGEVLRSYGTTHRKAVKKGIFSILS